MKKIIIYISMFLSIFTFSGQVVDIDVKTLDGKTFQLTEHFKGKSTYIKLWASWCPICLNTMEDTDKFFAESGDNFNKASMVFPGYAGEYTEENFKKWFEKLGYKNMNVLLDTTNIIAKKSRVRGFPANLFLNSKGEVELVQFGYMTPEQIRQKIKDIK